MKQTYKYQYRVSNTGVSYLPQCHYLTFKNVMDLKSYHKQLLPLEKEVFDNGFLVTLGREVSNMRADPRRNHQGCAGFLLYEFPMHNRYKYLHLPKYDTYQGQLSIRRPESLMECVAPVIPDYLRAQPQEETDDIFDCTGFLKDSEYYLDSE